MRGNVVKSVIRMTLVASLLLVAACKQESPTPQASQGAEATASATAATTTAQAGITASDGKLVLPAVKGNPGAAYFMLSNSATKPTTLTSVAIEGVGKAEMHETKGGTMTPLPSLDVPAGDMVMFERGGRHVMAFDLDAKLAAGGTAEMTLTFADGTKVSLPLAIEAAGGPDSGMDHGAMH